MEPLEQLSRILSPQGILTVTTGGGEMARFLTARYGSCADGRVQAAWRADLNRIADARVVILGVPVDLAGFEKGQGKGPIGIRGQLLAEEGLYPALAEAGVVDVGDCRNHPLLAHDELLNQATIERVRRARWGDSGGDLPVAPLGILERALTCIWTLNPEARVVLLGGDHGLSWMPFRVMERLGRNPGRDLGIVHFDAHTDLLTERDGVAISFATWAHHANVLIGRGGRLQQLGIRVSGRDRAHWEASGALRQFWAPEVLRRGPAPVAAEVVTNLQAAGVRRVWISNDIDGTDPRWAAATGTAEPGGLHPAHVQAVIDAVGAAFEVVGGDVVEVAPTLKGHIPGEPARTLRTAAVYLLHQVDACLGASRFAHRLALPEPAPADPPLAPAWV
jgi:arginase family enzyme